MVSTIRGGGGFDYHPHLLRTAVPRRVCTHRVEIEFRQSSKHELPVDETCTFSHRNGLATAEDSVCQRRDSLPVEDGVSAYSRVLTNVNQKLIATCMSTGGAEGEAACRVHRSVAPPLMTFCFAPPRFNAANFHNILRSE